VFTLLLSALVAATLTVTFPAQAATPKAPTGLTPTGVAVDATPVLGWAAVATATDYQVQVAASGSFDKTLYSATTVNLRSTPNVELPAGSVFWRVRARAGSTAGPWATASFNRNKLAGPALISPDNGAGLSQPDNPALLSWTPVGGATGYTIQVGTDANFVDPSLFTQYTSKRASFLVPDLKLATTYRWRVRASLANGLVTEWSEVRAYAMGALGKPGLVSPPSGAFSNVEDVVLDWSPVLGAAEYDLQVSTNDQFLNNVTAVNGIVGTRWSPATTFSNDQRYWRVRPVDPHGNKTDWSAVDVWTFRRHWPDQPTLLQPTGGELVGDPFYYQWSPVEHASTYRIELSTTSGFGSDIVDTCETVHTTYVPQEGGDCWPGALSTYWWRVTAIDEPSGVTTDVISADKQQFTYNPDKVAYLSPANGATGVSIPTLKWTPVSGASKYKVSLVATDGGAGGGTFTTASTEYTPRNILTDGKTYRWEVRTLSESNREGSGYVIGAQRTFTMGAAPVGASPTPTLTGPADGSHSQRFPTLSWTPVTGADNYKVLLSTNGGISWTYAAQDVKYPEWQDIGTTRLSAGTYDWYVEAYAGGTFLSGDPSLARTYVIDPPTTVGGHLTALTGDASLVAGTRCAAALPAQCDGLLQTPVLGWDSQPNAGYYQVWLSLDEEMTNIVSGYPQVAESTRFLPTEALADSQAGLPYYWFVQPCTTGGKCAPLQHADNAFGKVSKAVELLSPTGGSEQANDITFTWKDYLATNSAPTGVPSGANAVSPTVEALRYRIVVSSDQNFQTALETAVVDQPTYTSATRTYPEGPLYWRVQAIDGSANNLTFANGTFTKKSPGVTPLSPRNGVSVSPSEPFRWQPLPYAAGYQVEIYKDGDTTGSSVNRVFAGSTKQVAYTPSSPLPASGNAYTWRVRPVDADDRPGQWTDLGAAGARFFVSPAAPVLTSPGDNAWVNAKLGLFTWTAVSGAASYRFERRLAGSAGSAETVNTPSLAWAPTAKIGDGNWEWRVSAVDADGKVSGSSPWRAFRVDGTPPAIKKVTPSPSKLKPKSLVVVKFTEPVTGVTNKSLYIKPSLKKKVKAMKAKVKLNKTKTKATIDIKGKFKRNVTYYLFATSKIRDLRGNELVPKSKAPSISP
jgi:hypothetical protein